jgi:hypothetical protein
MRDNAGSANSALRLPLPRSLSMDDDDRKKGAVEPPPPNGSAERPPGYNQEGWEETLAWRRHRERQRRPVQAYDPSKATQTVSSDADQLNRPVAESITNRATVRPTRSQIGEILYCHAKRQTPKVGPGHWFFHTGQWAYCGNAGKAKTGQWCVHIHFAPYGKPLPDEDKTFNSIDDAIKFMSEYFDRPVIKVRPSDFPGPESL